MPALLEQLRTQYQARQDRYRALETIVAEDGHQITEAEQAELDQLTADLRGMQPRIQEAADLERSLAAGMNAFTNLPTTVNVPGRVDPRREPHPIERFRSWGEFAGAFARGEVNMNTWEAITAAAVEAECGGDVQRAIVDIVTGDVPGLVPPAWITTIAETISAARPFVDSFSTLPLPATGMIVNYPQITQRPLVGKQTVQKTDVASRKTTVASLNTPVNTYGGGEDVSVQVLQRTEPSYLSLMLQLYAEQMAIVMDTDAYTAAKAAITTTAVTLSAAAPAGWNKALADAVGAMLQASRMLPTVFVAGASLWAAFAGAADATGRPLFPNVNAFNPVGQLSFTDTSGNVRGLTFAVDPNIPPAEGIIGNGAAFTTFVGGYQTMSVDNPTKLGVDYAVFEFAAFAARRPDAAIKVILGA